MADHHLDARGLDCPQPILKTRVVIGQMLAGETLEVLATDPAADIDFQAYCRMTGHQLLEHSETDGVFRFVLLKSGETPRNKAREEE